MREVVPTRRGAVVIITALALLCCGLIAVAPARAAGGVYIALGDAYTSAPLVPNQHGHPIDGRRALVRHRSTRHHRR